MSFPPLLHLCLAMVILFVQTWEGSSLPHVSECNYCMKCKSEDTAPDTSRTILQVDTVSGDNLSEELQNSPDAKIFPILDDINAKQLKPNCSECQGCSTQLHALKAVVAFGQDFKVERGASPEWIYTADLPQSQGGGKAVIKVWCMPIDKVHGSFSWTCKKSGNAVLSNQLLLAQDQIIKECGLMDITIKVWVAPVNAVDPDTGLHIWWHGLWMERAEGISLNQLSYITRKAFVENTIIDLLQTKLNQTRVVRAAMLDLLTSQCDRHAQNVFVNENGQIKLIDNLQALKYNWNPCGVNSVFLPGTQMNEVARFGGDLVTKRFPAKRRRSLNPMVVLDYRCFMSDGTIGTNYPPELTQCLTKFSKLTPLEIKEQYNFPALLSAEALHTRAKAMIEKGFEWALKYSEPVNPTPKRYKWHKPCCKLALKKHTLACGHDWNVTPSFPKGDPISGRSWSRNYPDSGEFVGGTTFE